jgi:hypothetical protein
LAGLGADDVFLEPSAGTGIIASLAKGAVKQCLLNELEPTRADLLEGLFPSAAVYRHDGAKIGSRPSRWCNFGCGRGPSSGGFGGDV